MKVLVRCRDAGDRRTLVTALRELGHEVKAAETDFQARSLLDAKFPHVVLAEPEVPFDKGLDLFRRIRSAHAGVYVIALVGSLNDSQLVHLYEAGADHHIPIHASAQQLSSRLIPGARYAGVVLAPPATAGGGAPPGGAAAAAAARGELSAVDLIGSKAWKAMSTELEAMISKFLVMKVTTKPVDVRQAELDVASGIVLANAASQLELRIALGVDATTARALTMHLFGDDDMGMAADMLGEVANMTMGTLKTLFTGEAIPFTGSVPEPLTPEHFFRFGAACQAQEAFAFHMAGARIVVRVGVASKRNEMISSNKLREGMVLARDLHNERGMLLLRAGTRLSASMTDQLRRTLPPVMTLEVAPGGL